MRERRPSAPAGTRQTRCRNTTHASGNRQSGQRASSMTPARQRDRQSMQEPSGQPLILAVDDTEMILVMIEGILGGAGYRVVAAGDGPTALEQLEQLDPDMLIVGLTMPGMHGTEVFRRTRERADAPRIPVLVL